MWRWNMRSCLASWVWHKIRAPARPLWERVYPRRRHRGGWHGLRPCSRVTPLPQGPRWILSLRTCVLPTAAGAGAPYSIILHRRLRRVLPPPRQWLILRRPGHWHWRQQGRPRLAVVGLGRCTRGYLRVWRGRGRTRCTRHWRSESWWRAGSFGHGQASHQQRGEDRVKHQQPPVGNLLTGYA